MTSPKGTDDERERALDECFGNPESEPITRQQAFRCGYDAGQARAEQLERDKQALVDQAKRYKDKAEELEREVQRFGSENIDLKAELAAERARADAMAAVIEVSEPEEERLRSELAAERERAATLTADIRDWDAKHKQVFGNWQSAAAQRDRAESALAAERAESKRCREVAACHVADNIELSETLERVRALRDRHASDQSNSVFSRGLVEYLDKALSPAPPAEVLRCPSDIPCNPLGGRILRGCPLHDPSRQRVDKLGLEIEREEARREMAAIEYPCKLGGECYCVPLCGTPHPAPPAELERLRAALGEIQKRADEPVHTFAEAFQYVEDIRATIRKAGA